MFPQQIFTRSRGQRGIKQLSVLRVGPVETHPHIRTHVPDCRASVIIQGVPERPLVVRLPGKVTNLCENITFAVFLHDEDDVALFSERLVDGKFSKIHAAWPIRGNGKRRCRLPLALTQSLDCHERILLTTSVERTQSYHVATPKATVVAHAIN